MPKGNILGIDPGKKGAICLVNSEGGIIEDHIVPLIGKEIDLQALQYIFNDLKGVRKVYIERVFSMTLQGVKSVFTFGQAYGVLQAFMTTLEVPCYFVLPQRWQKIVFEGFPIQYKKVEGKKKIDTKSTALFVAKSLQPNYEFLATERSRVPNHNVIDAFLIAEYGRRQK